MARVTFEMAKEAFEKMGYELLETEYINSTTKMRYICPKHSDKIQSKPWTSISRGFGCWYCGVEKRSNKSRDKFDDVKAKFAEKGYKLLETDYQNNQTPMRYICSKHPDEVRTIRYSALYSGKGCSECGIEKNRKIQVSKRYSYDHVKKTFEEKGYILLEKEYERVMKPMRYVCPKHPNETRKITFSKLLNGQGCRDCGYEKTSGKNHSRWNGGTTALRSFLRYSINEWKRQSLKDFGYVCFVTGVNHQDLQIHHTYPFSKLIKETVFELDLEVKQNTGAYRDSEIIAIEKLFREKHRGITGIPLRKEIHKLFHTVYGYKNIDFFHVAEFRDRYIAGEFNKE